ncbi:hypothetical protein M433DRAFT_147722 [Acidomyces richmondensis BFW]|nr:MAG: hypothetical protein FE78DRAFT_76923 [Acidomyces sp. 'richmondensis']KYG41370.1 hypothetical protein M433DRAFT_147722 [Acidomyces richmondensis BFW]
MAHDQSLFSTTVTGMFFPLFLLTAVCANAAPQSNPPTTFSLYAPGAACDADVGTMACSPNHESIVFLPSLSWSSWSLLSSFLLCCWKTLM